MPIAPHRRFPRRIAVAVFAAACAVTAGAPRPLAQGAAPAAVPAPADSRLDWWREARFGMFIHWGLYAIPAGEWNGRTDYGEWIRNNAKIPIDVYDRFQAQFNPTKFDPDAWVRMAKAAGMQYIVITMNRNWGFNRADKDFKSTETLVRNLVDIASKGGNFLLNLGPTAEGEFPAESVERLQRIGAFMRVAGESIHGTQASPFPSLPWGRCTQRRLDANTTRLYLHVWDRPRDGILVVPGLLNDVRRARPMTTIDKPFDLPVERKGDDLHISLGLASGPGAAPGDVFVLDVAGAPRVKTQK